MKRNGFAGLIAVALVLLALLTACPNGGQTPGSEADIASFIFEAANNDALDSDVTATIGADGAIGATVPHGTDVTALVPAITIPDGATVAPESGLAQDFTNPVTYTVTAADGETSAQFTVTVTVAPADASTACDITGFTFEAAENTALSNDVIGTVGSGTVTAEVPFNTDVTALVPTITVSDAATVNPASATAQDFSSNVTYTVTAEDGATTQEYAVTMSEAPFQEVENTFDPNTLVQQIEHGTINQAYDYFGGLGGTLDPNVAAAFSADGSTLVIAAPRWINSSGSSVGSVFVFEYDAGNWVQSAQLTGSKADVGDYVGYAVAVSRDASVIVAGALYDEMSGSTNHGLAYVFERDGDSWSDTTETAILSASNATGGHNFGCAVGVSGDGSVVAVGAPYASNTSQNEGQVYVFLQPGGSWANWVGGDTEHARLEMATVESSATMGESLALSLDGSLVVAGAPGHDDQQTDDGVAFVFEEPAAGWDESSPLVTAVNETARLTTSTPNVVGYFAESQIAISDDESVVAIGCPRYSGSRSNGGAVFVYRTAGTWSDTTEDEIVPANDPADGDYFGISLSLTAQAGYLLVGAEGDDLDGTNKGSAYLFELDGGSYTLATTKFREPAVVADSSYFGHSVALSPDASTLCVTAPQWDSASYTNQGTAFIYR